MTSAQASPFPPRPAKPAEHPGPAAARRSGGGRPTEPLPAALDGMDDALGARSHAVAAALETVNQVAGRIRAHVAVGEVVPLGRHGGHHPAERGFPESHNWMVSYRVSRITWPLDDSTIAEQRHGQRSQRWHQEGAPCLVRVVHDTAGTLIRAAVIEDRRVPLELTSTSLPVRGNSVRGMEIDGIEDTTSYVLAREEDILWFAEEARALVAAFRNKAENQVHRLQAALVALADLNL